MADKSIEEQYADIRRRLHEAEERLEQERQAHRAIIRELDALNDKTRKQD